MVLMLVIPSRAHHRLFRTERDGHSYQGRSGHCRPSTDAQSTPRPPRVVPKFGTGPDESGRRHVDQAEIRGCEFHGSPAAPASAAPGGGLVTYADQAGGFAVDLPASWKPIKVDPVGIDAAVASLQAQAYALTLDAPTFGAIGASS
jgi:hypothetical protein